jgi:hypothetical protein
VHLVEQPSSGQPILVHQRRTGKSRGTMLYSTYFGLFLQM